MGKRKKPSGAPPGSGPTQSAGGQLVSRYWSGAHTRHRLLFHLVFCPKYRRRILEGPVATRLKELFEQSCEVNGWYAHEINVQVDHVHLLLQLSPRDSVPDVVQRLKGGSSRVLRGEFEHLEEFLWGDAFWSEGYFCETVGQRDETVVRRYIREQRLPLALKEDSSEEKWELRLDFDGQP